MVVIKYDLHQDGNRIKSHGQAPAENLSTKLSSNKGD